MTEYVLLSDLVALRREAAIIPDNARAYLRLYNGLHHLSVREIDEGLRERVEAFQREVVSSHIVSIAWIDERLREILNPPKKRKT